jgi:hypothetical protein
MQGVKYYVLIDTKLFVLYRINIATALEGIFIVPIHKGLIRLTIVFIEESASYQLPTRAYPSFSWTSYLHMPLTVLGTFSGVSVVIDLLPIIVFTFSKY